MCPKIYGYNFSESENTRELGAAYMVIERFFGNYLFVVNPKIPERDLFQMINHVFHLTLAYVNAGAQLSLAENSSS